MVCCLRLFLSCGIIAYESDEIRLKMLKKETSSEFYELMEDSYCKKNTSYSYSEIRQKLVNEFGEKYYFLEKSKKIVVEWIDRYAEFKGLALDKKRGGSGYKFEFI